MGHEVIVFQSALNALDRIALDLQRLGEHERALGLYDAIEALQKLNVYEVITVKGKYTMTHYTEERKMIDSCAEAHENHMVSLIGNEARKNGCVDIKKKEIKVREQNATEISIICNVIREKETVFIPPEAGEENDSKSAR